MIKKLISIIHPSVIYISAIYPFIGLNAVNYFAKLSLLDVWMGTWLLLYITSPLTITPKLVCHLSRREFMKLELPWWILKIRFPLSFSTEVKLPFETYMFSVNVSRNFFVHKFSTSGPKSWRRWTDFRNKFVYANLTRKSFAQSNISSFHFSLFVQ